jgi:ADP-ribose pyrophosphatase YjhB (NUDIX family)
MLRNETFVDAAKRLALGETGLHIDAIETLGVDNLMFPDDPFGHGQGTHTVTVVVKCVPVTTDVKIDGNHDHYTWWDPSELIYNLHPYVTSWSDTALGLKRL